MVYQHSYITCLLLLCYYILLFTVLFMLHDWSRPHSYYSYTCADPARHRGTSYLAGVAFWQPWTFMFQVLEPGHWILYLQEIIAFLISSWRPLFSLFSRFASIQLVTHFQFAREDSYLVFIHLCIVIPFMYLWYSIIVILYLISVISTYLYSDRLVCALLLLLPHSDYSWYPGLVYIRWVFLLRVRARR